MTMTALDRLRFDWYQCSPRGALLPEIEESQRIASVLCDMGLQPVPARPWGGHGFRSAYAWGESSAPEEADLVAVWRDDPDWPLSVRTSGEGSPSMVSVIRSLYPYHGVSRVDVCLDVQCDWDWAVRTANALKGKKESSCAGDWLNNTTGRTLYLGAPSSAVRIRLYEKGRQLVDTGKAEAGDVPEDLVRLEFQFRPPSRDKVRVSRMTAAEIWCLDATARALLMEFLACPEPPPGQWSTPRRTSPEDRLRYVAEAYARTFGDALRSMGSREAVMDLLWSCWEAAVESGGELSGKGVVEALRPRKRPSEADWKRLAG